MKNHKTLILDKNTVKNLVNIKESIKPVEYAFRQLGRGKVQMPAKIYLYIDKHNGDFRAMPAYIDGLNLCSVKWVNVHPDNEKLGLLTVMAIIILSDPKTGLPLCIMDGTYATQLRTGAAGAVAAGYLARKGSSRIGLVGCGAQARSQLLCLNEIFMIKEVKVWGHIESLAEKFIKDMKTFLPLFPGVPTRGVGRRGARRAGEGLPFKIKIAKDIRSCVEDVDIIVTTTPTRKPLIKSEWINKGMHINAIGADSKGKQELDPSILKNAKVVVDNWEQASHSGEINVPISKGIISKKDIYADIGEIVSGKKKGRTNNEEITVFDSTGLAIQDLAIANLIYKKALKNKKGAWINLI